MTIFSLAIMQPYFMPYLGYFSLLKHTNHFILLDEVQFIRHGWIERNRILKQNGDWQYIKVPLIKHSRDTLIKDIKIDNTKDWQNKLLAQLQHYKKKAPYYNAVIEVLNEIFINEFKDITHLNKYALSTICNYLDINCTINIFSEMALKIEPVHEADEWALNICKALGDIKEYWNPPGGQSIFNKEKYDRQNIKLRFQSIKITEYRQLTNSFEPGLSIIDVMMFNSIDEINNMLDNYVIN
jgi:hypothetical protein